MKPLITALVVLGAVPSVVRADPPARAEITAFETRLDRAISRVSRPAGLLVLGLPGTRAYRISGLGVIFVLPPRALDIGKRELQVRRHGPSQVGSPPHMPEDELRVLEQQVLVFADAAESTHKLAEGHAAAVEKEVRIRLELEVDEPPQSPDAPRVQERSAKLPSPPPPPTAPPWLVWLQEAAPEDHGPPAKTVERVRSAVLDTLETHGARLASLEGEEHIVVAVDFVAPEEPFAPPERQKTLVVRVKKQALVDRAAGRLTPEDLRKSILVDEY